MSYDIYFVRRDPGESFEDALDNTEDSFRSGGPGPLSSAELEQWDRILRHAREIFGEIEEFGDQSTRELSHGPTGVQLSIFSGEVSLRVRDPAPDQDEVSIMEKVYVLARAVEAETGLEGFDPQLSEPVTDAPQTPPRSTLPKPSRDTDSENFDARVAASGPQPQPTPDVTRDDDSGPQRTSARWWEFWKW